MGRRVGPPADAGKHLESSSETRIGLLGGTFDPPHIGHLWLAETARQQLHLDTVLFLPVGSPPHKQGRPLSSVEDRMAMVRLAVGDVDYFALDGTDVDRPPPHTTVTLLPLMQARFPETLFWLLVGTDSLRDLKLWHLPEMIIRQCRLAALPRPGVAINWHSLEASLPGVRAAVDLLDGPQLDISSSDIRQRARSDLTLRFLVPKTVGDYIKEKRPYR